MATTRTPPMDEAAILSSVSDIIERRVRVAALRRAEADADASAPRRRLSVKAWRAGCLRQAGHDATLVQTLRTTLRERGAQFPALAGYVEAFAKQIREGIWGGPPAELVPGQAVWNGDREGAAAELALIGGGVNLWTAIACAVEDVAESIPTAFGPVDDPIEEKRQRQAPEDRADEALRDVEAIPTDLLVGRAWRSGIAIEPIENLATRIVAHAMNPPAAPRRESERRGEVAFLGAPR